MIVVMAFAAFHTINGIRLIFNKSGYGLGRPRTIKELTKRLTDDNGRPRSLNKKNTVCISASIGIAAFLAVIGYEFLGGF